MTKEQIEAKEDNWRYRRGVVFFTLAGLGAMLGYLTVLGDGGNAVQSMLAQSLPIALVAVVLTYVAGPIADDAVQLRLNRS